MRCPARAADARDFPALYDLRRLDVCSHAMFCAREPTQLPITSPTSQATRAIAVNLSCYSTTCEFPGAHVQESLR